MAEFNIQMCYSSFVFFLTSRWTAIVLRNSEGHIVPITSSLPENTPEYVVLADIYVLYFMLCSKLQNPLPIRNCQRTNLYVKKTL